jgi:hypothetical protein
VEIRPPALHQVTFDGKRSAHEFHAEPQRKRSR